MNNLEQKIKDYFGKEEIKNNLDDLIQKYFKDENQKKRFLDVLELIKKGEFNIDDLYEYSSDWLDIDIETAIDMDQELFDKVYGDIYDELQELYEQKQKEGLVKKTGETVKTSAQTVSEPMDLMQKYNNFVNSSLFQNILASQEQMKEKYGGWLQSPDWSHGVASSQDGSSQETGANGLKNDFYEAINAGDKIKVAGILRMVCQAGKLQDFFKDDKRYVDFFGGILERHQGKDKRENFEKNPSNKKYLIEFLKFILEKRVSFSSDEAVMLGVGLGSLCNQSGEKEYADIAYGDENKGSFVWAT